MSTPLSIALYVAAVLVALFLLSGVLPAYRRTRAQKLRARTFRERYEAWVNGDDTLRDWLTARRTQMQADAQAVGRGVSYVAAPPALGGGPYLPHHMYTDLFNEQSFTDDVTPQLRLDDLLTAIHDLETREDALRSAIWNPAAWAKHAFELLIRFPRYLLRQAGFSQATTDSRGARVAGVLWSTAIGLAAIGSFVIGLLQLLSE